MIAGRSFRNSFDGPLTDLFFLAFRGFFVPKNGPNGERNLLLHHATSILPYANLARVR